MGRTQAHSWVPAFAGMTSGGMEAPLQPCELGRGDTTSIRPLAPLLRSAPSRPPHSCHPRAGGDPTLTAHHPLVGGSEVTEICPRNALRILASPDLFLPLIPVAWGRDILLSLRPHRATRDERAGAQGRVVRGSPRTRRDRADRAGIPCARGPAQMGTMVGVHRGADGRIVAPSLQSGAAPALKAATSPLWPSERPDRSGEATSLTVCGPPASRPRLAAAALCPKGQEHPHRATGRARSGASARPQNRVPLPLRNVVDA